MCHVCMRYEIKVINVGGFNIDDLEPDRQSAKFSGYTVYCNVRLTSGDPVNANRLYTCLIRTLNCYYYFLVVYFSSSSCNTTGVEGFPDFYDGSEFAYIAFNATFTAVNSSGNAFSANETLERILV